MGDLDFSCGGLLPLIAPLEAAPALCDDRGDIWLTRGEVRAASLGLAEKIASERKQLVFLFCGANSETVIGLLAAATAGHATALIDPSLPEETLKGLIDAYRPDLVLGASDFGEKLRAVVDGSTATRSLKFQSRRHRMDRRRRCAAARSYRPRPPACLDLGEKIAVAHEEESDTALKSRIRELAANYKVPSSSFALRKVAQIPRGASGKIDYARLKETLSV